MMTRRSMVVKSLKSSALFGAAVAVFGCGGNDPGGTQTAGKPAQETLDSDKKTAEARAKAQAEAGKK